MKRIVIIACALATLVACGIFAQKPVCPAKRPLCWEEDPAMRHSDGNELPMGAARDAGVDG